MADIVINLSPGSGAISVDSSTIVDLSDVQPDLGSSVVDLPHTDLSVSHETGYLGLQGPPGASGTTTISSATDIDMSNLSDGSMLVYNDITEKWHATLLLEQQIIDSGQY